MNREIKLSNPKIFFQELAEYEKQPKAVKNNAKSRGTNYYYYIIQ